MPKASLFPINTPGSRPVGIRSQTEARGQMSFFLKMTAVEERSKWNRSLLCCQRPVRDKRGKEIDTWARNQLLALSSSGSTCPTRMVLSDPIARYQSLRWRIDDHDAVALAILEEQDRAIAAKSGIPVTAIERIRRSDNR